MLVRAPRRFYGWNEGDIINCVDRSHFDAENGRVGLALVRLHDIAEVFPNEPYIIYEQALLKSKFLGQGIAARELFEHAYECNRRPTKVTYLADPWIAAFEALRFARNREEFQKWAEIALREAPPGQFSRDGYMQELGSLDKGEPYWNLLVRASQAQFEEGAPGTSAALIEVALATGEMDPEIVTHNRQTRAERLRALDTLAHIQRQNLGEAFPPEERLALQAAITEIDQAIALDEYKQQLWNFKAAWLILLERYEEALLCADRAISIAPYNYSKPHLNKAIALWNLRREGEALSSAKEALTQAESDGLSLDTKHAREMIDEFSMPRKRLTIENATPLFEAIVKTAQVTSDRAVEQWQIPISEVDSRIFKLAVTLRTPQTVDYALIMAEILADFPPETVFSALLHIKATHAIQSVIIQACLGGAMHIVATSLSAIERRDATRLLALAIFSAIQPAAVRRLYRQTVLVYAAGQRGTYPLDKTMRAELSRFNPELPSLIADNHDPIRQEEIDRVTHAPLSDFGASQPSASSSETWIQALGCIVLFLIVVIVMYKLLSGG